MTQSRFSPKFVAGIMVALFFGIALYLRIFLPYDQIFSADWIKLVGTDSYYHMRIIDNLVHNFPRLNSIDPYMLYPSGMPIGSFSFFDYLLAGIIWLVGLGSPTQHTVDMVGVYFPAVLGTLSIIPVYFIGKVLFNRWVGVLAAGLITLSPGEFLARSILGRADHHCAEVLFTTIAMLFLILAVKIARERQLNLDHLKHRDWGIITKPLIYSLLAGIFLGLYLLTWLGALLFVFIIFLYLIIQFIIDHVKQKSTDYLCLVGTVTFLIALIVFAPLFQQKVYLTSLIIALLTPIVLSTVSRLITSQKLKPAYYPLSLMGLGLAGLAILYFISPSLLSSMLERFSVIMPVGARLTILEAEPFLFPGGDFSFLIAWLNFATGFFLSFVSLGILIYFVIKQGEADRTLFIVWSLVILAATLSMRRFAYYFAINVALLTGYFSWLVLQFAGFKETAAEPVQIPEKMKKKTKQKKSRKGGFNLTGSRANMALGIMVVFFLVFYPNIGPLPDGRKLAIDSAKQVPSTFAPDDAWCEALSWLGGNTSDPFGDPDFYYELYESPPLGERYSYPDTAYSVISWWDYGYWIARIGRRLPICNPGGGNRIGAAEFFIAQDEDSANEIINELDSKYVIIDHAMATTKFYAMPTYAGSSKEEFYDVYYQPQEGRLEPVRLLYPEYYRSLAVRLYNFDGREIVPQSSAVISYEERVSREGVHYKEITSSQLFRSYEEAEVYISNQKSGSYKIVGTDPLISPVPLGKLEHYQLVYASDSGIMLPDVGMISLVKVFEYAK